MHFALYWGLGSVKLNRVAGLVECGASSICTLVGVAQRLVVYACERVDVLVPSLVKESYSAYLQAINV